MWKLGLERVTTLADAAGNPHRAYPVLHVAGTNGKGSTIAALTAMLSAAGYRVGRFTSPHLVDFRERIVVDDKAMSPSAIVDWLDRWEGEAVNLGATFFETTTVMAFDYFARMNVDIAVVEVGLGGRLDATNIVQPIAAAVTQIGFDHMEFLGTGLHEIAAEKAGIFKKGVPAIIGETATDIQRVLIEHAEAQGASPILVAGKDWMVRDVVVDAQGTAFTIDYNGESRALRTPLIGDFQANNTATALTMLRVAGKPWNDAAATATASLAIAERIPVARLPGARRRRPEAVRLIVRISIPPIPGSPIIILLVPASTHPVAAPEAGVITSPATVTAVAAEVVEAPFAPVSHLFVVATTEAIWISVHNHSPPGLSCSGMSSGRSLSRRKECSGDLRAGISHRDRRSGAGLPGAL